MRPRLKHAVLATACIIGLSACASYVKKEDFDRSIGELRSEQSALRTQVDANRAAIDSLRQTMEQKLAEHDAKLIELAGRLHVDMNVHFAYDDATLRDVDKPALDSFAKVLSAHHPQATVTVEGFTDAAGNATYNRQLGQRRADAVKDYLASAGLAGERLRAVSYGKSKERQLSPGAWGDNGLANRRVTLVVDLPPAS